nr:hypothetical protein [Candidatus Omnitrophota bacterium]
MKPEETKSLAKQSATDNILNAVKAAISAIPYGGGVVASLISDYIPKSREKRTLEFLKKVAEDLESLKGIVNEKYIQSEEFEYLFQKAWRVAVEHYQNEKVEGFRAILINSAIGKEATADDKDLFINILNDLTGYHFQMLKVFQDPVGWNAKNSNKVKGASMMASLSQIFRECFPDWGEERIIIILDDLFNKKLCTISSERLKVMISGGGIEKFNNALTPFGRRFIDYVTFTK